MLSAFLTLAAANIADAEWLAGRWVGEGLGGAIEETWAPPAGGQMVGYFRLIKGGKVDFYEMMMMDVTDAGVRMRVKHFHPTFIGWEDKDGWHSFEPVAAEPNRLKFEGLTLEREGQNLTIVIRLKQKDGSVADHPLKLRRAPL